MEIISIYDNDVLAAKYIAFYYICIKYSYLVVNCQIFILACVIHSRQRIYIKEMLSLIHSKQHIYQKVVVSTSFQTTETTKYPCL